MKKHDRKNILLAVAHIPQTTESTICLDCKQYPCSFLSLPNNGMHCIVYTMELTDPLHSHEIKKKHKGERTNGDISSSDTL